MEGGYVIKIEYFDNINVMKDGFLKVCAATPDIKVADTLYNGDKIIEIITKCQIEKVKLLVFPELCITGYTCGDLFLQNVLLVSAKKQLLRITEKTIGTDMVVFVGLPFMKDGKLYNVAAVIQNGTILGMIPKMNLPNYSEFCETRYFVAGNQKVEWITIDGMEIPFGNQILFACENEELKELILAAEICEDLWVTIPPSSHHALAGATVIANLSASPESTGKDNYRRELVKGQSARLICAYIYADSGEGESTTDLVFGGHNLIVENGSLLKESRRFQNGLLMTEIDIDKLTSERRRMTTFFTEKKKEQNGYVVVRFGYGIKQYGKMEKEKERECAEHVYLALEETILSRTFSQHPFVQDGKKNQERRYDEILSIQALGLKKRLEHTNSQGVVLGISGGLDSTLALLVIVRAFDMLRWEHKKIMAVTMPCFGTTDRTYQNAIKLAKELGVLFKEISIRESVLMILEAIGHDIKDHDVTYENAQARMRTQVLMNLANQNNSMVIGTGDMSELALGFATYNGDHMSMYGVNASVPKTLVRYLVSYYAETTENRSLKKVLLDILDTPVSPELLPPEDGVISQRTEDIVGPYELHDFYLYYILRFGFSPSKIYRMAVSAFEDVYNRKTIYKWLEIFYKRFFSQQFKRSCLPDGPKIGSVGISPRGDLRMPSDACVRIWIDDLEKIRQGMN